MVNLNDTPSGAVTALDLDAHLRWKAQPLPAEACTEVGADQQERRRSREREYLGLVAICTLPWAIVIGVVQLWHLVASLF